MNRVRLDVGQGVLLQSGPAVVTRIDRHGYAVTDILGEVREVGWVDLQLCSNAGTAGFSAIHVALRPAWDMLDEAARQQALDRLEVVLETLTGYRSGQACQAEDGEPFEPFGLDSKVSAEQKYQHMARLLTREREVDRRHQRRILAGELRDRSVSARTIRNWVLAWQRQGLLGLVDGRKMTKIAGFDLIAPEFRAIVQEIVETLDGDRSSISHKEVIRRAKVRMKQDGKAQVHVPQRASGEYVAWLIQSRGLTTRAQRSKALRGASGTTHAAIFRPGQVVAIDVTRADVLVWDPLHQRAFSVEIITAIDVATRVVLALRVVPKSADGVDAGLLLYDVMRPFSLLVSGTSVSDWRWAGVPEALTVTEGTRVNTPRGPLSPVGTLQGEHTIPGVLPEAIRSDHGSIFMGTHFQDLLKDFGIDYLPSRGRRPVDNAHVERLHETYRAFYLSLPGFKGRNTSERGSKVEAEPVMSVAEFETALRRWVALEYHQTWHQGLPPADVGQRHHGDVGARMTPLSDFDARLEACGRIDLPLTPTALYQFLPIRWGTIAHAGVEFENLVYDARCLDAFRSVRKGQFREKDRAMPFFYDPHDVSRVWWSDPDTGLVHEVPWRGAAMLEAPMTDLVLASVRQRINARGGNLNLNRETTQRMILDELTELTTTPSTREWRAKISAAARRVEASTRDHAEAQEAQANDTASGGSNVVRMPSASTSAGEVSAFVDEWPDLDEETS